jgi:hypothetical protein
MQVSSETFGFDPYKGKEKKLRVIFSGPGGGYERRWDEGDTVRFRWDFSEQQGSAI